MKKLESHLRRRGTFAELRLGCLPPARSLSATAAGAFRQIDSHYQYFKTEPDAQTLGTCVADATTGVIEAEYFRRTGRVVQLNYGKLYFAARKRLYGDSDENAGLCLPDAAIIAVETGLLPSDTQLLRVPLQLGSILDALEQSPLITAHGVDDGWLPQCLDPITGQVDETFDRGVFALLPLNAHATLCCGSNAHNGADLFVHRNSWGALGLGGSGLFCMSTAYSLRTMLDKPLRLAFGPKWADHEIPDEWLVKY